LFRKLTNKWLFIITVFVQAALPVTEYTLFIWVVGLAGEPHGRIQLATDIVSAYKDVPSGLPVEWLPQEFHSGGSSNSGRCKVPGCPPFYQIVIDGDLATVAKAGAYTVGGSHFHIKFYDHKHPPVYCFYGCGTHRWLPSV
jgi:hypothetical protein